jgi:hypothetical protein
MVVMVVIAPAFPLIGGVGVGACNGGGQSVPSTQTCHSSLITHYSLLIPNQYSTGFR